MVPSPHPVLTIHCGSPQSFFRRGRARRQKLWRAPGKEAENNTRRRHGIGRFSFEIVVLSSKSLAPFFFSSFGSEVKSCVPYTVKNGCKWKNKEAEGTSMVFRDLSRGRCRNKRSRMPSNCRLQGQNVRTQWNAPAVQHQICFL